MGLLKAEQVDDDVKRPFCVLSFYKAEDEARVLVHLNVGHRDTLEVYE